MPQCGCFHNYELTRTGSNEYKLGADSEGHIDLPRLLQRAGLVKDVSASPFSFSFLFGQLANQFTLTGIENEAKLRNFLDLLKSRISIDLSPGLDECYALAPHMLADEENGPLTGRSCIGELVYQAKSSRSGAAAAQISQEMASFVSEHPRYANAGFVVAVPPSATRSANVPSQLVNAFRSKTVVQAYKTRQTQPQKGLLSAKDEAALKANISNSVGMTDSVAGAVIIVVDDMCGSGETLKEVARACRAAGAKEVLGLVATKDATLLQGGVSLVRGNWQ